MPTAATDPCIHQMQALVSYTLGYKMKQAYNDSETRHSLAAPSLGLSKLVASQEVHLSDDTSWEVGQSIAGVVVADGRVDGSEQPVREECSLAVGAAQGENVDQL